MPEKQNTLFVGSLAKGLKLLRVFDEATTEMSLSELVRRTGLEKSAVQRLANTLHLEGMLDKDLVTKRFRPSHAWLEMAYAYFWSNPLVRLAMPKLIDLSHQLDATVNLAEMSGDHVIYVSRIPGRSSQFSASIVGRRLPALCSAAGRAMLSTMPREERMEYIKTWPVPQLTPRTITDRDIITQSIDEAESLGYALTRDQMILNQAGVSAPVRGPNGVAVAAIQISVLSHQWSNERIKAEILPYVIETALGIDPQSRN